MRENTSKKHFKEIWKILYVEISSDVNHGDAHRTH